MGRGSLVAATAVALGATGSMSAPVAAADAWKVGLIKDIRPGSASSSPREQTVLDKHVFFSADNGANGRSLWKSDGTAAGTSLVKSISAGGGDDFNDLTTAGRAVFFTVNRTQLWKSDGTSAGTVKLKTFAGDGEYERDPRAAILAASGGTIYFSVAGSEADAGLWKSDGTTSGTVKVKALDEISTEEYDDSRTTAVVAGGTLFFAADDGENGMELWKSNGTTAGTVMVKDIDPRAGTSDPYDYYDYGPGSSKPTDLTVVGSTVFFTAEDEDHGRELWKTNGSDSGTVLVKDIQDGDETYYESNPSILTAAGSTLFFVANDGEHGRELWKSTGSEAGTTMVKDIRTDSGYSSSQISSITPVGSTVYFSAGDATNGEELWKSNGTSAGTTLVKDIRAGSESSSPRNLTAVGSAVFFAAEDAARGTELWRTDGSSAGTVLVKDINTNNADRDYMSSYPEGLTALGSTLVFSAYTPQYGNELWSASAAAAVKPQPKPSNSFVLPRTGKANLKNASLTISVRVPAAGTLALAATKRGQVATVRKATSPNAATALTIKPSSKTLKAMKKKLKGKKKSVAQSVKVAVTFTPKGGTARTVVKTYVLKLKKRG